MTMLTRAIFALTLMLTPACVEPLPVHAAYAATSSSSSSPSTGAPPPMRADAHQEDAARGGEVAAGGDLVPDEPALRAGRARASRAPQLAEDAATGSPVAASSGVGADADAPDADAPDAEVSASGAPSEPSGHGVTGVLNLNTATEAQLDLLPGVGPAMTARIVAHRAKRPFRRVSELRQVKGIGPAKYKKLAPFLRVDGESTLRRELKG